ncbi:MAG: hypothetical protein ACJAZO_001720 [Myxococcota bacterium]|jgi:hypothetical protein
MEAHVSRSFAVLSLVAVACGGNGDLMPPMGVSADCGTNAPVITELEIEEGDPFTLSDGSQAPGLLVNAKVTDADGDLHWYEMKVWFDEEIDGIVAPEGTYYESYGPRGDLDCGVQQTEVPLRVAVNGYPPRGQQVEVGVIVYDDMETPSNDGVPFVVEFTSPE